MMIRWLKIEIYLFDYKIIDKIVYLVNGNS